MSSRRTTVAARPGGETQSPVQLLRSLTGWLDQTGHDLQHPWQMAIARTLATYGTADSPSGGPAGLAAQNALAGDVGTVFGELADLAGSAARLLAAAINHQGAAQAPELPGAVALCVQIGAIADQAADVMRCGQARGGFVDWLATPTCAASLEALDIAMGKGFANGGSK